jgi:single-strand DNA-binding protein
MNKFLFTGNLGKDAELKATASGTSVLSFSVAVKSGYGDNAKTNWIHCAMFGKRAEGRVIDFLKKGAQVAISGEFELKEWDSQDGTKNKMPSVRVDELDLIGGKPEQSQQGYQPPQPQGGFQQPQQGFGQQQPSGQPAPAPQGGGFDDDMNKIPW